MKTLQFQNVYDFYQSIESQGFKKDNFSINKEKRISLT